VEVVAHLFAVIPENDIRGISDRALHKISKKAMELRPGMSRPRKATAAEANSLHPEITPVFLHQDVGGDLGYAKKAVHRPVDILIDSSMP
jgi:hypothetical protein